MSRDKRQDLRGHLKPGAQGAGYGTGPGWNGAHKKSGCPLLILVALASVGGAWATGWQLAAAVFGGAA